MLEVDALLRPAVSAPPCGPDMQYSAEFTAIERDIAGKPERQAGKTIIPAEPPDWLDIADRCGELLTRTKDLRVAAFLARALVQKHGFCGLTDAVALLRGLVERYWGNLHPALDRDDADDPTERLTAITALAHHDILAVLRSAPIAVTKTLGTITARSLEPSRAAVAVPAANRGGPTGEVTPAAIEAALAQSSADDWRVTLETLERCSADIDALRELLTQRVGSRAPELSELRSLLASVIRLVRAHQKRVVTSPAPELPRGHEEVAAVPVTMRAHPVESRDDVLRSFDEVCSYYGRMEPSSPVPLLLQRCRRLVTLSFADVLKELVPEAIPAFQKITGKSEGQPNT